MSQLIKHAQLINDYLDELLATQSNESSKKKMREIIQGYMASCQYREMKNNDIITEVMQLEIFDCNDDEAKGFSSCQSMVVNVLEK